MPGDALRSLANPTLYDQPDNMDNYYNTPDDANHDNGGVHTNSGIPNKAAYLIAKSIGMVKTAEIYYDAYNYLNYTIDFKGAANAIIQAATDLYGASSTEVNAVKTAFTTVKVLSAPLVTFNSQGGSAVASKTADYNSLITAPTSPTNTGYTFSGWYKEAECLNTWDFMTDKVTTDTTLYAKWTINNYTVTFNSQGGSAVTSMTADYNSLITAPIAPTNTVYTFGGWYKEVGCINTWNFMTDKVTTDTTLYAKWTINNYTVTFNSQGGSAVISKTADYNSLITAPTSPTKTGYTFGGWYKETGCINAWNFMTDKITTDTTLYAKWTINNYTVTFNSQGGSAVTSKTADYNSVITAPVAPTKTGYTFGGWYNEVGCLNAWNFTTDKVTTDTTLYAKWTINNYTVTFNSQGGSAVTSKTADYNSLITAPTSPTKTGYTFGGWYKEAGCLNVWNFSTDKITRNATLYAKWTSQVQRLSGINRIETSIAIAKEIYKDKAPDAVVLATANNFPDALAGSGLAYKYNAPLLLVDTTVNNSKNVLNYITTNLVKNKNIYVLGGADVVSKEIADYLITKDYKIIRLEGKDRYETNQKIVNYMNIPKGTSIVLATGDSFADALSISSIAAIKGFPILLNSKDNLLANVSNDITNIQPTTVYLIGDTGVLSTNIETQIKHLNSNTKIVRLGGLTRYDTSMKILEYFNLSTTTVTVATGLNFPDALSGSVLAARKNCGVLLVDNKDVTKQKELLNKQNITNIIVFGGDDVVSNTIANLLIQK